jgi:arabinofuranosyltransferase
MSLFVLARFDYQLTGIDDANIYFVYARHLASGQGFVYNIGGERVEGFTSLLWTLICALAFKFSSHPELILLIINIVIISVGIATALTYLQNDFWGAKKSPQTKILWSGIFLILLLTSPRYIVWNTITLMENGPWSTLLLVTTIFVIKEHPSSQAINSRLIPLLILLVLTRPESILWGSIFIGVLYLRLAFAKSSIGALRDLVPSMFCFVISVALMMWLRFQYFGYLLPNTYYAKVSPSLSYDLQQGSIYLSKYIVSDPIVLLSVMTITISGLQTLAGIFSRPIPKDGSFFLPIIAGSGLLEPLITGGDHFGSFRVYQNIYPIEILCLFYFIGYILPAYLNRNETSKPDQLRSNLFRLGPAVVLALVFFLSQIYMWSSIKSEIGIEFEVADYGRKNGTFIQELFTPLPELPSLGVVTSGGIKYSYKGDIVDLMGLNNTIMAHNHGDRKGIKNHAAFDIQTFYQLQPDIVWPRTVIEKNWQYTEFEIKESWENKEGLKGLFDEPNFLDLYNYAKVSSTLDNGYALVAWFKKDFLKQLESRPDFRVEEYRYTR